MRMLFEEYSSTLLQAFICVGILSFFIGTFIGNLLNSNNQIIQNELSSVDLHDDYLVTSVAQFEVKDSLIQLNDKFDYKKYVSAINSLGDDISSYVTLLKEPNTGEIGDQKLTYLLRYNGQTYAIDSKLVIVNEKQEVRS